MVWLPNGCVRRESRFWGNLRQRRSNKKGPELKVRGLRRGGKLPRCFVLLNGDVVLMLNSHLIGLGQGQFQDAILILGVDILRLMSPT